MSDDEDTITRLLSGQSIDKDAKRHKLMKQIKKHFCAQQGSRVVKVDIKNIVIIGRSRTGKSTIKTMLVDPAAIPNDITLISGTRDATLESFFIDDEHIILNIIDTPGVFEHHNEAERVRDNDTIMDTIDRCINLEITKFHLICFAFSMPAGIQSDDIEALQLFIDRLGPDLSRNSCLIVTRAESKSQEQRDKLRQELLNDNEFKKISHYFKRGIYFTGSINYDDYLAASTSIIDQYKNVLLYRNELLHEFAKNCEPFQISESYISDIQRIRANFEAKYKELELKLSKTSQEDHKQRKQIESLKKELDEERKRMMSQSNCVIS